jgi:hypothetical protein
MHCKKPASAGFFSSLLGAVNTNAVIASEAKQSSVIASEAKQSSVIARPQAEATSRATET